MTRSPADKARACQDALRLALASLADRNYVRLVLDYDRARRAAGDRGELPENLLRAADELGVRPLVWGVETALKDAHVAPVTGLRQLEQDLDGLANAWLPADALKLDGRARTFEALSVERRAVACAAKYRPSPSQVEAVLAMVRAASRASA